MLCVLRGIVQFLLQQCSARLYCVKNRSAWNMVTFITTWNIYHNATTMYQVISGANGRLSDLIPIRSPQHSYGTRNRHLVFGKDRRLVSTSMSVLCVGPQGWNELSKDLNPKHPELWRGLSKNPIIFLAHFYWIFSLQKEKKTKKNVALAVF